MMITLMLPASLTVLNKTLAGLLRPATLFAFNNEAYQTFVNASNNTADQGLNNPLDLPAAQFQVMPDQYYSVSILT